MKPVLLILAAILLSALLGAAAPDAPDGATPTPSRLAATCVSVGPYSVAGYQLVPAISQCVPVN